MNRYNNPRLTNTTVSGTGVKHPMRPHVILGDPENGFIRGDLLDANAVIKLIKNAARAAGFPQLASSLDWVDVNDDEAMIVEVGYVTIKSKIDGAPDKNGPDISFLAIKANNELGCVFIAAPAVEGRPTQYYAIKLGSQDYLDKNLNQAFPATVNNVLSEECDRRVLLVNGSSNDDAIPSITKNDISEDVLNKIWENKKVIAKNKIATITTIHSIVGHLQ